VKEKRKEYEKKGRQAKKKELEEGAARCAFTQPKLTSFLASCQCEAAVH